MSSRRLPWFAIRVEQPPERAVVLYILAFLIPIGVWCLVSYCPWVWHPMMVVTDTRPTTSFLRPNMRVDKADFAKENARLAAAGLATVKGEPANPIFLPAPHEVGKAFYTAFVTPPNRKGEPWLHESLWHSIQIIFWGFITAAVVGVPLGVLCGTWDTFSKMTEPFVDFVRYMPAPAFGALMVAVLGIDDAPKIAIIWIGTFFQMVLVVGNTTRRLDKSLLEAAQTLGAGNKRLVMKVIVPGILPNLYNDMRILLGWAWTYLIVAELIGASSGISYFINQQGKYRNYANVYAAIIMIGIIGLVTDQILAQLSRYLFPYAAARSGPKADWMALLGPFRRSRGISKPPIEPVEVTAVQSQTETGGASVRTA